jgi:hypothetical protein
MQQPRTGFLKIDGCQRKGFPMLRGETSIFEYLQSTSIRNPQCLDEHSPFRTRFRHDLDNPCHRSLHALFIQDDAHHPIKQMSSSPGEFRSHSIPIIVISLRLRRTSIGGISGEFDVDEPEWLWHERLNTGMLIDDKPESWELTWSWYTQKRKNCKRERMRVDSFYLFEHTFVPRLYSP